jgi:hypothetical protein
LQDEEAGDMTERAIERARREGPFHKTNTQGGGFEADLESFRRRVEEDQAARFAREYPDYLHGPPKVTTKIRKKFALVDVDDSGKYMVDIATGEIFGIKGYGRVHRGHCYGTLATISQWDWGGYQATRKAVTA